MGGLQLAFQRQHCRRKTKLRRCWETNKKGENNNKVKQLAAEMCSLEAKALEVSPEAIGSLLEGFGVSNVQAHDVLGTGDEEEKKLPGNLLGLLLTLPKQAANPTSGQSDESKFLIKQARVKEGHASLLALVN